MSPEDLDIVSRVFLRSCGEAPIESLSTLLSSVPSLNINLTDDISDRTCMHETAIAGRLDVMQLLLSHGGSIDAQDVYGRRPIHYAAMHGHGPCTLLLISVKSNVEAADHDGSTPLVHAVRGAHGKVIEILFEAGAKLESAQEFTPNPLSIACKQGFKDVAELLLKRGAKFVPDGEGLQPIHITCRQGYAALTSLLIQFGSPIDSSDNVYGWQPIFFAASEGHLECTKALLAAGCRTDVRDESQWLPWTYALYHGHVQVAKLLQVSATMTPDSLPGTGIRPMAPSGLFGTEMDVDINSIDAIPSLSLPPPIIPFRIYGHNYLDKKCLVQIQFGSFKSPHPQSSPLRLFGSHQLSSLKLVVSAKPDTLIPYSVVLPLKDVHANVFMVNDLSSFSVQFDVYPTFGTKPIGRTTALPSILKMIMESSWSGAGEFEKCVCPLFDSHLRVVGELEFEFSIVKPFVHPGAQIGGKVETYWKSTTVVAGTRSSPEQSGTVQSFITASSLAEEYLEAVVQMTRDGIPVIYPHWFLPLEDFPVDLSSVTYAQAKAIFVKAKGEGKSSAYHALVSDGTRKTASRELAGVVYDSLLTLEELLQVCANKKLIQHRLFPPL